MSEHLGPFTREEAINEVGDLLCDAFYRFAIGPMEARQIAADILDRIGSPLGAEGRAELFSGTVDRTMNELRRLLAESRAENEWLSVTRDDLATTRRDLVAMTTYAECLARGLSDSEARGTAWPNG